MHEHICMHAYKQNGAKQQMRETWNKNTLLAPSYNPINRNTLKNQMYLKQLLFNPPISKYKESKKSTSQIVKLKHACTAGPTTFSHIHKEKTPNKEQHFNPHSQYALYCILQNKMNARYAKYILCSSNKHPQNKIKVARL